MGEAIDITVRALDAENKVASDYRGAIIFVSDYLGDTLPMQGKTINFTEDDAGEKKFSKGMIFKKAGKQKIYVMDVTESLEGDVSVVVDEGTSTPIGPSGEISIITPEKNAQITGDTLLVSGMTRKNSKVNIRLNGTDLGTVLSDDTGLFTKEVTDVGQENNVLQVSLLDASSAVIASSDDITFVKSGSQSSIYGLTVTPDTTVVPSAQITFTVDAVSGLSEVNIMLDNAILRATEEGSTGKYHAQTVAPQAPGEYAVDVEAKSLTAEPVYRKALATLKVQVVGETPNIFSPSPAFRNVRADTTTDRITFSFSLDNPPSNLGKFKILYGTGMGALDAEIITHDAGSILKGDVYTWYIATLPPNTYTFKVYALDTTGALIPGLVSDPVTATVGVQGCTISNVGAISVRTDASKSVLSWSGVENVSSYNIYKVDADGKYTLFQSTKDTSYTIFLSKGAIVHENFAIKAVCGDGTESADYSGTSRVQTGPGMIAFLVVISGLLAVMILRRRSL